MLQWPDGARVPSCGTSGATSGGTRGGVDDIADACAALSAVLWLHRGNLETLLFKLVEEQLVVTSGSTRWLNRADAEVLIALERLQEGELLRGVEVESLTAALGLPAEATLAELASAAPEPWATLLDEHRSALRSLAFEIKEVAAENRALLDTASGAVRETLDRITRDVRTYNASGRAVAAGGGPTLLDQQA
jgi:hypothetical protein